jgi:hypothetical protein
MNAPTELVASDDLPSSVIVTWSASPGGLSFELYRTNLLQEQEVLLATIPSSQPRT